MQTERRRENKLGGSRPHASLEKLTNQLRGVTRAGTHVPKLIERHVGRIGKLEPVGRHGRRGAVINDKEKGGAVLPLAEWNTRNEGVMDKGAPHVMLDVVRSS